MTTQTTCDFCGKAVNPATPWGKNRLENKLVTYDLCDNCVIEIMKLRKKDI
jgi:hypothetical protein